MAFVAGTDKSDILNAADGATSGADTIYGHDGDDFIYGLGGDDGLIGGAGADFLDGWTGIDIAYYFDSPEGVAISLATTYGYGGTAEGDRLHGIENIAGSGYDDYLAGQIGANELFGLGGHDILAGGGGSDSLNGGSGNDILNGGSGADTLYGDSGIDAASYYDSPERVIIHLFAGFGESGDAEEDAFHGIENIIGSAYNDTMWGDAGANVLRGMDGHDALNGMGGDDILEGGNGHDALYGLEGTDTLRGEWGDDVLSGNAGDDTMIGGMGGDTYHVDNPLDVVIEFIGQGNDTVFASYDGYVLGFWLENLTLLYTAGPISGTGNSDDNIVTGNDWSNGIDGGAGADQMVGRGGDDTYFVDNPDDTVGESGGEGADEVRANRSWNLTAGADVETLRTTDDAGTVAINLTGNGTGNVVVGNNGANLLNGGDGNDELTGLGGADSFVFDTPLDAAFNVDVITDFNVADDTIRLDQTIFSSLGVGNIADGHLVIGTVAQDANDQIIYDSNTGALFYDNDGVGANTQVRFATLSAGLALTHLDFLVVP
jgi:Ca2+-binding RTX toxin-like protein